MFIFLLQLRHVFEGHPELYLFSVYSLLIWLLWLIKVLLSRRYRPYTGTFTGSTSVVVPVVDEPLDLFRDVLGRMVEQRPGEIIVVINGAPNPALEEVSEEFAPLVRWVHTPIPGKRNAVKIGTQMSNGDITVLVDSDTVWTPNTLSELVKPFADDRVGGVTTRQRILEPERSWITRWADWLENSRSLYSMPAQSALEYSDREFSSQSAHRVIQLRSGSRIRWRVVTPPTRASANGFTSSERVFGVQTVSESTSTVMSPVDISVPIFTAFRLPGIGVCTQRTNGANSSETSCRPGLGAPLITTMISPGRCSTMRPSTSRNRSSGSSTTGTTTLVVPVKVPVNGR